MNKNDKPALIFDKKYHTDAGEVYIFPFGYTMDEVSELLQNQATSKKARLKLKELMDNLDDSWFPYKGIEKLGFDKKWDILFGMASGFNPDDIIWYSIEDKKASHRLSEKLRNEIEDFSPQVESSMNWVISPKTWKRIKPKLIEYKKQYGLDTDEYYAQWYKELLSRPIFTKEKFSDKQVAEILNIDLKRFQKIKNMKYADGGELQDSDLRDIVLKSFKDEEGFDFGFESGRSYRYKSEDYTAKKSVNYNGEDYTVEFRVKVMYEAEGAATIEELTVDGIDVDLELFSKDDREEVETFFDDMSENIGQGYAKGGKVQKRPRFDNLDGGYMADGGEVKWQDARIGDSARVKSENKMGVIKKDYGRKFHLKFVDGTEKTYDASELEFIKDEYADGGELEWGEDLGDGFSVGTDVIITNSGKTGFISGLSGKDLLVTISEDGEDMSMVVSKSKVKMLDAPEYAKGGSIQKRPRFNNLKSKKIIMAKKARKRFETGMMADGGMMNFAEGGSISIKDLQGLGFKYQVIYKKNDEYGDKVLKIAEYNSSEEAIEFYNELMQESVHEASLNIFYNFASNRTYMADGGMMAKGGETFDSIKSSIESASGDKISHIEYDDYDRKIYWSSIYDYVTYYIGSDGQIIKYDGETGERYPIGDLKHYDTNDSPINEDLYADGGMMAKGGKVKSKRWIQDALTGNKGALRATAKRKGLLKGDEKLSKSDLHKLEKMGGKTARRAHLAETLRDFK